MLPFDFYIECILLKKNNFKITYCFYFYINIFVLSNNSFIKLLIIFVFHCSPLSLQLNLKIFTPNINRNQNKKMNYVLETFNLSKIKNKNKYL